MIAWEFIAVMYKLDLVSYLEASTAIDYYYT